MGIVNIGTSTGNAGFNACNNHRKENHIIGTESKENDSDAVNEKIFYFSVCLHNITVVKLITTINVPCMRFQGLHSVNLSNALASISDMQTAAHPCKNFLGQ